MSTLVPLRMTVLSMYLLQAAAATDAYNNFNSFIAGVNFREPTWDLFIVLFFLLAALVYGLTLGRERVVLVLVSTYMALAVVQAATFLDGLAPATYGPNNIFVFRLSVFLLLFILIFFLLSRNTVLSALTKVKGSSWWQAIMLSVLHVGLLVSIALSFVPAQYQSELSPLARQWFMGESVKFFWIAAPIAGLFISRLKKEELE